MGGKRKPSQRVKNNARPSSSGRSAELLATQLNPFVGFTSVKDVSSSTVPVPGFPFANIDESDVNLDTNFQLVLKKMNKKDATTKLKALQEFTELVGSSEAEAVKTVLAFWPRLYAVLAVDVEHRVREATHQAHHAVVKKVKRNLAPYLKQLAGPWFTSQYDTYAPAASAATQSFEDAFPPNKLDEAIVFCQDEILAYICDNLTVQTPQTLCNPKTTSPEEAEAKYERLQVASLQGYTLYLTKLSKQQLEEAEEANKRIISNAKFWKLAKTKIPFIRAAWFGCITALCQYAPFLLKNHIKELTGTVFSHLDETEPTVLNASWEAALYIVSNIEDWCKYVNIEKLFLPKLWKILKDGGQGSAVAVFPNLLPLVSHLPQTLDGNMLFNNFFENIRTGMKKRSVLQSRSEFNAISIAFIECLRYIIMKNITNVNFCENLIRTHLVPTIEWCFSEDTTLTKALFNEISTLLQYWGRNRSTPELSNYQHCIACFWLQLDISITNSLAASQQQFEKEKLIITCNKHIDLFLSLKKKGQRRSVTVKFAAVDKKPEAGDIPDSSRDVTCHLTELNIIVYKTCVLYLKLIKQNQRTDLIQNLCLLVQYFDSRELFVYLNRNLNDTEDTLLQLHNKIFFNFLRVQSTTSESVVDLIFSFYNYLTDEEKKKLLETLEKLSNEDCMCWCVAKAFSHPYCKDIIIQNWLATEHIKKLLLNISLSMLNDEISPDKSLLLKQAFHQNENGDLYISKDACKEIMLIFCNCLLSPNDYPFTIDICASFAAQLAATLYTENTLLTYGDQLILALFSLSCNSSYDSETLSKDTLWEVSTAWQDIITLLIYEKQTTEFENIVWKFTKIIHNEFLINFSNYSIARLTSVAVDLMKAIKDDIGLVNTVIKSVLNIPGPLRAVNDGFDHICTSANILHGVLSYLAECPVTEQVSDLICNDEQILKYLFWNQYVIGVLMVLFKKPTAEDDDDDDDEQKEEEKEEAILEKSTNDINSYIIQVLHCYSTTRQFLDNYKTTKLYSKIQEIFPKIHENISEFMVQIISVEMRDNIIKTIENNNYETLFILHKYILVNSKTKLCSIYTNLIKKTKDDSASSLQLTQLFSKYLNYDHVLDITDKTEKMVVLRALIHAPDLDIQIAELLTGIVQIREKNVIALFYDRDISSVSWIDLQYVVEIIRLFTVIIEYKPESLSPQHWDVLIISLTVWFQSVEKSKYKYNELKILQFICAVCELYVVFYKTIDPTVDSPMPNLSTLRTEYNEIFAQDVHVLFLNSWMYIAEQELKMNTTNVSKLPALEMIGNVIPCLQPEFLLNRINPKLPKWQEIVQLCARLLKSPVNVLQKWGYHCLKRLIPELVALDTELMDSDDMQEYGLMCSQLASVLTTMQEIVLTMLMDFKLGEDSCRVEPFTDSYSFTLAYLLLWDILLSLCQHATTNLRYQYSDWLRSGDYLKNLLNNLFKLMPTEVLHCIEGNKQTVLDLFTKEPSFSLTEAPTSELLEQTVCWIYARAVSNLPAAVRQWWSDLEARPSQTVEHVTAAYISPMLCNQELLDVIEKEKSSKNNMKVKVHMSSREVIATYCVDDLKMELIITLPTNYPLGVGRIHCNKQIGGTQQSRNWIMQLTIFLTHQNGRIWDGLSLWKNNLDKKFDGVEECYICFSVLHMATYQLPKLSCQTCRKKFHAPCLYKWFSTSNKSTCPICRNLF